jgi:homogentisate 1,2-dioxygenase
MLERRHAGELPDKPHTVLRAADGSLRYEHCLTRNGFDGAFSILYHEQKPHLCAFEGDAEGFASQAAEGPVVVAPPRRRLLRTDGHVSAGGPLASRTALLFNADLCLYTLAPYASDAAYFTNVDADDLYFVREGAGILRSPFGDLAFGSGDYVAVPRGVVHRFVLDESVRQRWLGVECFRDLSIPAHYRNATGQLRMDAPYSHRDFRAPEFRGPMDEDLREVVVKRGGRFHRLEASHSPLNTTGWDGCVYPTALSIHRFSPRVGQVHLPPSAHATFAAGGALICSFVPRPLDFHPDAIPCPYPHSSVHVDEVLYYCDGEFGSREGVEPGALSFHPAGVPHGPHGDRYEASISAQQAGPDGVAVRWTNELAVMVDTEAPLSLTETAIELEWPGYHSSF